MPYSWFFCLFIKVIFLIGWYPIHPCFTPLLCFVFFLCLTDFLIHSKYSQIHVGFNFLIDATANFFFVWFLNIKFMNFLVKNILLLLLLGPGVWASIAYWLLLFFNEFLLECSCFMIDFFLLFCFLLEYSCVTLLC